MADVYDFVPGEEFKDEDEKKVREQRIPGWSELGHHHNPSGCFSCLGNFGEEKRGLKNTYRYKASLVPHGRTEK